MIRAIEYRSFIYIENNRGPKMDPRGIPDEIDLAQDSTLL